MRSVESKDKKKEMHRTEVLYDIEEHETACVHKSPSGRWFWTSQQRIKEKKIIPKLQKSGYMKSVKSRRYWSDCTLVHETDAPGL